MYSNHLTWKINLTHVFSARCNRRLFQRKRGREGRREIERERERKDTISWSRFQTSTVQFTRVDNLNVKLQWDDSAELTWLAEIHNSVVRAYVYCTYTYIYMYITMDLEFFINSAASYSLRKKRRELGLMKYERLERYEFLRDLSARNIINALRSPNYLSHYFLLQPIFTFYYTSVIYSALDRCAKKGLRAACIFFSSSSNCYWVSFLTFLKQTFPLLFSVW